MSLPTKKVFDSFDNQKTFFNGTLTTNILEEYTFKIASLLAFYFTPSLVA